MDPSQVVSPPATWLHGLPNNLQPLHHQVAGHASDKKQAKFGFLECGDGTILKPLQDGRRGDCELDFYRKVSDPACTNPTLLQLRVLVPRYLGTKTFPDKPVTFLRLEDVTAEFKQPCIADIKLGCRTYDPLAGPEKIAHEIAKYPPSKTLGFQFRGMRVYDPATDSFTRCGKELRKFTEDNIQEAFRKYFSSNGRLRHEAVVACLAELHELHTWFKQQTQLSFYASSALMIYEGNVQQEGMEQNDENPEFTNQKHIRDTKSVHSGSRTDERTCPAKVRLIDFAHVFPVDHIDENNLHGLDTLVTILEGLLM